MDQIYRYRPEPSAWTRTIGVDSIYRYRPESLVGARTIGVDPNHWIVAGVLALVLLALSFMVHCGKAMREFTSGLAFPLLLTSLGVSILSIIWGQGFNWVTFVAGCGLLSSLYAIIRAGQQRQVLHVSAV